MNRQRFIHSWKRQFWHALCFGIVAILLVAPVLQAGDTDVDSPDGPGAADEVAQPNAVTADDGGSWELGVHGSAGNLTQATAAERAGMWYWLDGWFVRRYSYNESSAWERDFKRAALGGTENSYIDAVDLQFYVGHGAPGLFTFDNANWTDGTLSAPNDCNTAWGDGDNEWFALTSCQVLADSGIGPMAQCMNRQHLILGFVTNASAHNNYWDTQAYHFSRYMRSGYNMTQSWFNACDVAQRGRTARVIAEETACFNDNPYYSNVCADVIDSDYYWYTHNCGTESASYVPLGLLADELPVFKVDPYSLDEAKEDFQQLGNVFSIPVTPTLQAAGLLEDVDPPAPADSPFLVSSALSKTMELDENSGIYKYTDLSQLWTDSSAQQAMAVSAADANYITNDDARRIADSFLAQNNLMPGDAFFYEVVSDTVGTLAKGDIAAASVSAAETPSMWQVIYSRKLSVPVVLASGLDADLEMTIVGPGAKQKVYVPIAGQVNAAGVVGAAPAGVQGGWRSVSPAISAATGEQIMTTIINTDTATALYRTLDKEVTMNSIPLDIENQEVLSSTLAYWENAPGSSQGELIPVYELLVKYNEVDTGADGQDLFYLPASSQYMRPIARILNAPADDVLVQPTAAITLTAADASKTLKELGIGDAFDFVMGYNGADGTYTYEWYLGSVAEENKITDLNPSDSLTTITFQVPTMDDEHESTLDVFLVVKDLESPNEASSTTVAQLSVGPAVFLPFVNN